MMSCAERRVGMVMRRRWFGTLVLVACCGVLWLGCGGSSSGSAASPAAGVDTSAWVPYSSATGGFFAKFPLIPTEIPTTVSELRQLPATQVSASTPDWSVGITYFALPEDEPTDRFMAEIRGNLERTPGMGPIDATSYVKAGCNVWALHSEMTFQDRPAVTSVVLYFCPGGRSYSVIGVALADRASLVDAFLESFVPNP